MPNNNGRRPAKASDERSDITMASQPSPVTVGVTASVPPEITPGADAAGRSEFSRASVLAAIGAWFGFLVGPNVVISSTNSNFMAVLPARACRSTEHRVASARGTHQGDAAPARAGVLLRLHGRGPAGRPLQPDDVPHDLLVA